MSVTDFGTEHLLVWHQSLPGVDFEAAREAILGSWPHDGVRFSLHLRPTCYRRGQWSLLIETCSGENHHCWGCFDSQDQPQRYYHSRENALSEAELIARVLWKDRLKLGPVPSALYIKDEEACRFVCDGKVLDDPKSRSADLQFFLSECENGFDGPDDFPLTSRVWVEGDAPVGLFGCRFTWEEVDTVPGRTDPFEESQRDNKIHAWAVRAGGWAMALTQSPVLGLFDNGKVKFLDGWHRTKMASLAGHKTVRAVVGVRPEDFKELTGDDRR